MQPTDSKNITGEYDPSIHGFDGMTCTSLSNRIQPFVENIIAHADELGGVFDFNLDLSRGRILCTSGLHFRTFLLRIYTDNE
jgi:hypothetical protein